MEDAWIWNQVLYGIESTFVKAYWTLRRDVRKGEIRGSGEVIRVVIPLITWGALESDKGEKVAKTNVWVMIKRKGK